MFIMNKCYLCNKEMAEREPSSVDRVPPKCFFPSPRPSSLITIECHESCNQSYSKDEENFRADVVSG